MSIANNSDRDWELWGKTNPYYGVLSAPQFLHENLQEDSLQEFFMTGNQHVEHVFKSIQSNFHSDFKPNRVLDYGCGVGRLLIPFAHRAQTVVGVDVSPSMLKLARENCDKFNASSARLMHADELDSLPASSFDLIHSVLVFQHIPVDRGERILKKLLPLIAEDGVGAIHFSYSDRRNIVRRGLAVLHKRVGLLHGLLNLVRGQSFSHPMMQGNPYSMNRIFDLMLEAGYSNLHVELIAHGHTDSAMLYFKKPRVSAHPAALRTGQC